VAHRLLGFNLAFFFSISFPCAWCLHGLWSQAWRGAPRLVRLLPCLLAVVLAMAFAGFSCMVLIMRVLGPVDMGLRIVDIFASVVAHV
jgi:hypothetical protein